MKLQGMSIIFALVCLPIVLVIAYYISLQIDTITLQNMYDSKLLDATYDAMSAFELNTANEDLSSVSDSLRTIIEASNNIFMNTLATNLGMSNASKSYLEPYVPAILYTLYDGYYIYAPTYAPTVITDSKGNAVSVGDLGVEKGTNGNYNFYDPTTNSEYQDLVNKISKNEATPVEKSQKEEFDKKYTKTVDDTHNNVDYGQLLYKTPTTKIETENNMTKYSDCTTSTNPAPSVGSQSTDAKYKTQNVLKSYIPYSARYVQKALKDADGKELNVDINVIYTLDNYITIDGTFTYPNIDNRKIYYTKSGYLIPFTSAGVCVRVFLDEDAVKDENATDANAKKALNYNQNEIQEFIEAGRPVRIDVLKNLEVPDSWETIIEINDDNANRVIIDSTNQNRDSANVRLTRYENMQFALEEFNKKVNSNLFGDPTKDETNAKISAEYDNLIATYSDEGISFKDASNNIRPINDVLKDIREKINELKYNMQLNSAAVYYAKAAIFSNWVKDNLSDLQINSIQDISGVGYSTYTEQLSENEDYLKMWQEPDENKVFDFTEGDNIYGTTEIKKDSSFYNHKLKVIRASIQYNLNQAMSAYNRHAYYADDAENYKFDKNTDYAMPIMSEAEWDQILNNISIVAFMQGVNCKLKTYNNYAVVSSTNNEIMTTADNIYYAKQEEFNDGNSEYHTFNCSKIKEYESDNQYISFTSKEVKYDKLSTNSEILPYKYDHKNLACYDCINDSNYKKLEIFKYWEDPEATPKKISSDFNKYYNLRKAFYIGVAKERNDIYKMNAVKNSEGYEIIYMNQMGTPSIPLVSSILDMKKIREIEVVLGAVDTKFQNENVITFSVEYPSGSPIGGALYDTTYSVPTRTINNYTWKIKVDPNTAQTGKFSTDQLYFNLQNADTSSFYENSLGATSNKLKKSIKEIRIIYK